MVGTSAGCYLCAPRLEAARHLGALDVLFASCSWRVQRVLMFSFINMCSPAQFKWASKRFSSNLRTQNGFRTFFFFVTAYLRFYPRHRWPHLSGTTSSRCKCASFQGFRVSGNRQANYMLLRISFPGSFPHTPSHVAALVHRPSKLLRCIFIFCVFFFLLLEFEAIEVKKWSHGSAPNTWRPMRIRRFVPIIWWAHVPFAGRTSQFRDCRGSYINTSHICAIWVSVTGATCRGHSPRPKLRSHPRCEASGLLRQRILPLYVTRKFFRQIIGEKDALSLFTLAAEWREIQK